MAKRARNVKRSNNITPPKSRKARAGSVRAQLIGSDTSAIKQESGPNTGLTNYIRELTPEELNSMTQDQLKEIAVQIRKVVNDNRRRLLKSDYWDAPWLWTDVSSEEELQDKRRPTRATPDGEIKIAIAPLSTKGLDTRQKLMQWISSNKPMLDYDTGSIRGMKKWIKSIDSRVSGYKDLTTEERAWYWDLYESVRNDETSAFKAFQRDSERIQRLAFSIFLRGDLNHDQKKEMLRDTLQKIYEAREAKRNWMQTAWDYEGDGDELEF